jgi:hypothetical protein
VAKAEYAYQLLVIEQTLDAEVPALDPQTRGLRHVVENHKTSVGCRHADLLRW